MHFQKLMNQIFGTGCTRTGWSVYGLIWVMPCRLFGAKPLPTPMRTYDQSDIWERHSLKFESKWNNFHTKHVFENGVYKMLANSFRPLSYAKRCATTGRWWLKQAHSATPLGLYRTPGIDSSAISNKKSYLQHNQQNIRPFSITT